LTYDKDALHRFAMEISDAGIAGKGSAANRNRDAIVLFVIGVLTGLGFNWTIRFLPTYEGPAWLKLGISLLPWLLFALFMRFQRRVWRSDELEKLIDRDAIVFAFYVLLGGFIVLDQLQAAGLVTRFKWANGPITLVMIFAMLAGMIWSKRRYR